MNPNVRLFTIKQAAEILGCTVGALRRRVDRRAISCSKVGGRWQIALDMTDLPKIGSVRRG